MDSVKAYNPDSVSRQAIPV